VNGGAPMRLLKRLFWHENGLEVEYGIADPSWIAKPLDPDTRHVLASGYQLILDKGEYFLDLGIETPVIL